MRKDFNWLWVLAIPLIVVFPMLIPSGGNALLTLAIPFTAAGGFLRALSLAGETGNLVAIGLYVLLCVWPLLLLRRSSGKLENGLLLLACGMMFRVMWLMVNPSQIPAVMRNEVGMAIHAGAVYSVVITWGLMKLMNKADLTVQAGIYSALRIFLIVCAVQFVVEGLGFGLQEYRTEMNRVIAGNTALTSNQMMPTFLFLTLEFCFGVLEHLMIAWILLLGTKLLDTLEEDPYSEACHKMSGVVFSWCRKALPLVAMTNMILNLGQVLLAPWLLNVDVTLRIPALSLAVTFGMMALTRLLGEGRALKEDNDLFI